MADIIDTLAGMDDAALSAKLGFDKKLDKAKSDLADMAKLDGDARKLAVERVTNLLNPTIYTDELGWIVESAQRKACKQTAAEAMCDCSPDAMLDD
jgi:hypothetical protein